MGGCQVFTSGDISCVPPPTRKGFFFHLPVQMVNLMRYFIHVDLKYYSDILSLFFPLIPLFHVHT